MIIRQALAQAKCDQCMKVSESLKVTNVTDVHLPEGWIYTQSGNNNKMHIIDNSNRQVACIDSSLHFCCTSCFMIYLHAQMERYLDLIATVTEEV